MAKKKELSEDLRQGLVRAHSEIKGYTAISKQYDVHVETVQSIINKCPTTLPRTSAERSTTTPGPQPKS